MYKNTLKLIVNYLRLCPNSAHRRTFYCKKETHYKA